MAIKAFNSIAGFSVGYVILNIILGNGDIRLLMLFLVAMVTLLEIYRSVMLI